MKTLTRLSASGFALDEAHTLGELEALSDAERQMLVYPTDRIFSSFPSVALTDFFSKLAHSGQEIYLHKIGLSLKTGERVKLYDKTGFFAVGEVRLYDGMPAIKPIRQF